MDAHNYMVENTQDKTDNDLLRNVHTCSLDRPAQSNRYLFFFVFNS